MAPRGVELPGRTGLSAPLRDPPAPVDLGLAPAVWILPVSLARISHQEPAARRAKPASAALRWLAVLLAPPQYASARQASRALYPRASDASRFDPL